MQNGSFWNTCDACGPANAELALTTTSHRRLSVFMTRLGSETQPRTQGDQEIQLPTVFRRKIEMERIGRTKGASSHLEVRGQRACDLDAACPAPRFWRPV